MSKTKDELLAEAAELGVDADESMTNAEIQAAIDAAEGEETADDSGPYETREDVQAQYGDDVQVTEAGGVVSVTLNPDQQSPPTADLVWGADSIEDTGDLEYTPEALKGVSQDRWYKPAEHHGYPVETDEERQAAEDRQAAIDEANEARAAEREELQASRDTAARERLANLLGQ